MDDDERFLAVAQVHLTNGGVDVMGTARNSADALRQAETLRPDIVLIADSPAAGFIPKIRLSAHAIHNLLARHQEQPLPG